MGDPLDGFETFLTFNDYDTYYDYFWSQYAGSDGYFYTPVINYPNTGTIFRTREPVSNEYESVGEIPAFTEPDVAYIDGIWWANDFSLIESGVQPQSVIWSSDNGSTWNSIFTGEDWRIPSLPIQDPVSGKWVTTVYSNSYPGNGAYGPTYLAHADLTDSEWTVNGTPFTHGDELDTPPATPYEIIFYQPQLFLVNGTVHAYASCTHSYIGRQVEHRIIYRFGDGIDEPPDTTVLLLRNDNNTIDYVSVPEPLLDEAYNYYNTYINLFQFVGYTDRSADLYVIQYDWAANVVDGEVTAYRPPRIYYSTQFPPVWNLVETEESFEFPWAYSQTPLSYDGETWVIMGCPPFNPSYGSPEPYLREGKKLFAGTSLASLTPVDIEPTEEMWFVGASYLGNNEWVAYAVADAINPPEYWMVPRQGGGWGITLV